MRGNSGRVVEGIAEESGGKMVLLVADGLGGLPHPETGLTEGEAADTPNLDALVTAGVNGLHIPIERGVTPGSGPAHIALFGYDPVRYEIGRGVLEALGIDFDLRDGDVAVRMNFATVDGEGRITDRRAGRIPTEKCVELAEKLNEIKLPGLELFVRPVKEHRAVLVFRGPGLVGGLNDTDPQETGVPPVPLRAEDKGQEKTVEALNAFLGAAREILKDEPRANALTMRGIASLSKPPSFPTRFKAGAAAIASYPMYRGVARLVGMDVPAQAKDTDELVGLLSDNFDAYDFLFVHFKKTDSTGEDGDYEAKVAATEEFDRLVGRVVAMEPDVLVVTGDHSTPSALASHSWHPVPITIRAGSARVDAVRRFGESHMLSGGLGIIKATDILPLMLAHAGRLAKFGA
ncbi:MAG: 2,3-bisphosphoglycerate-independent phosphoglycerate mutase [Candidatus Eisenbacteria bacterium]|nr:2,3-bisphosphoglycerate-independent phosphoglycerate mutase [Candidatus Eisenbacteria bacterium]